MQRYQGYRNRYVIIDHGLNKKQSDLYFQRPANFGV